VLPSGLTPPNPAVPTRDHDADAPRDPRDRERTPMVASLGALVAYAGFALAYSYPLALHLGSHVYRPPTVAGEGWAADTYLVLWILTWNAHALATDPRRLFDANHLYPARNTLATSENLLGHVPFSAPVFWATGNAVLAAHVAMFATYVIGAFALFLLLRRWTGMLPAFVAGLVYAFAPWRIPSVGNLNFMSVHWWPVVLLAMERAVATGSLRALTALTAAIVASALCSLYFGYVAFFIVLLHALTHHRTLRRHPRRVAGIAAASIAAMVLLIPVMVPYARLRAEGVVSRHSPLAQFLSLNALLAQVPVYLPPLALVVLVVGIATWALRRAPLVPGTQPAWRLAAYLIGSGTVLALGTYLHVGTARIPLPYLILTWAVPGFSSTRVPLRFFALAGLGVAIALGLVLEGLRRRLGRSGQLAVVVLACVLGAELFLRRFPVGLEALPVEPDVPAVYRYLREHGGGRPLLELGGNSATLQARSMYFSTFHWLPLLNGHAGHVPPTTDFLMRVAKGLPDAGAVRQLASLVGLGWVLVPRAAFGPHALARWEPPPPGLERVGDFRDVLLYRVVAPPTPDLRARFRNWFDATTTLSGTPLAPLPPAARSGLLRPSMPVPAQAVVGQWVTVPLTVQNTSRVVWPAYGVTTRHLVVVRARWIDKTGQPAGRWHAEIRLPEDVPPGGTVAVTVEAPTGGLEAADLDLDVTLAQGGEDFPPTLTRPLRLPVRLVDPPPRSPAAHT
jgi:hypothetical protein